MDITETIDYRGYTIYIHDHDGPANPFEDWDCEPPMLVASGHRAEITCYGMERDPPDLIRTQIKKHATAIARALDHPTLLRAMTEYAYGERYSYATACEMVNSALGEYAGGLGNGADLTAFLAQCWEWAGCAALDTLSQGYSQGHYADLLVVLTPEWLAATGIDPTDEDLIRKQLQGAADLYSAWAWGDVYGYTVTDPHGEDTTMSCWGFYGADHDDTGLLENARSDIDSHIHRQRREHLARLRINITHRVPLQVRQAQEHIA